MKLATIRKQDMLITAIYSTNSYFPIDEINKKYSMQWYQNLDDILQKNQFDELHQWYNSKGQKLLQNDPQIAIPEANVKFGPLFLHPPKIWGIGLNYKLHASDLSEKTPSSIPASFMKADTTIIGANDIILLPWQSKETTGEAELGIIIKKKCKNVTQGKWLDVVAGFTTVIDMTAEDILRQNPRYLTISKNFDTFFSFGPLLITPDDIDIIMDISVATVINGKIHAKNVLSNMTFPPNFLVSFHSEVMTLLPGDIISTGTPRAVKLKHGDVVECQIDGFPPLKNPVNDLKIDS